MRLPNVRTEVRAASSPRVLDTAYPVPSESVALYRRSPRIDFVKTDKLRQSTDCRQEVFIKNFGIKSTRFRFTHAWARRSRSSARRGPMGAPRTRAFLSASLMVRGVCFTGIPGARSRALIANARSSARAKALLLSCTADWPINRRFPLLFFLFGRYGPYRADRGRRSDAVDHLSQEKRTTLLVL